MRRYGKHENQAPILELSHGEFKITMNSTLRDLIEKGDNMQGQMGNISREMEMVRIKKKCLKNPTKFWWE